ncbi:MAG: uracil-DNA glycosylase [Clostridia bacterium]|nr:uracil-DNA glycosylase [Clostridia bacterium]
MSVFDKYREACSAFFAQLFVGESRILVFGEGAAGARLMLIGEAPGEQETLAGRPFVGKAGKNLDQFLEAVQLNRSQLYITNAVKVRPTKVSAKGRVSNRPPTREEITLFQPWLAREINLVEPGAIATLGNVALRAVTGKALSIGQAHGRWLEAEGLPPIFPLYHPASVIYNPALAVCYADDLSVLAGELLSQ